MDTPEVTSGSAEGLYSQLETDRQIYLDRAIEASTLTIPTLVPPRGHSSATKFPTPYQSVGARGVNNLASKLLLALLPPNTPCFRYEVGEEILVKLALTPDKMADVQSRLAKMERSVQRKIETEAIRVSAFEAFKHLLVAGNCLLYMPEKGGMRVFHLHNYVVQRDPSGNVLDIVTKEQISPAVLTKDMQEALAAKGEKDDKKSRDKTVAVYTHVKWVDTQWTVYQEVCGIKVPNSEGTYPKDKSPWIPLRMTKIDGESYGRGYVEEYLGDLKSLEGLSQAIVEGAAAAAKILFLVNPNGSTDMRDLAETPSGGFAEGLADDVHALQLEKYGDFRVSLETSTKIEERLSFAFMLNSAVQRSGERVTAEEIRYMAQELESALGGIYSILGQEFQLPVINRLTFVMQRQKKLPALPKGMVQPVIVTGLEALGRGNDLNKLDQFMGPVLQIEEARAAVNWDDYMKRRATAIGIDTEGLIKTPEQVQQEQQQQQMMAMMQQGVGPAVSALGGMAKQGIANHGKSQPGPTGPSGS